MPRSAEVKVDMELMRQAEALPAGKSARFKAPTEHAIAALRRYWKTKDKRMLAAILPCTDGTVGVHPNTAREWYRRYVEGEGKR